jgi:pimeloyl-ACP methyl ester carboxylesterase
VTLYYEQAGEGVPILLVPPAGSTASTWGSAADELARIGLLITYDRRGYVRSGGDPPHAMATHTADAAALLEQVAFEPAVVVGTSAGAGIAVDLAVRRPDLVRAVVAHEFPWRMSRHPVRAQAAPVAKMAWLFARRRHREAAEVLLRTAYSYRDGGSAWDAFPEEWRRIARDNARVALADFINSIGNHPSASDLATIRVPVVCSYGSRSPDFMPRRVSALAAAIPGATLQRVEGAGHAAPFDAASEFVRMVARQLRREPARELSRLPA